MASDLSINYDLFQHLVPIWADPLVTVGYNVECRARVDDCMTTIYSDKTLISDPTDRVPGQFGRKFEKNLEEREFAYVMFGVRMPLLYGAWNRC